MRVTIIAVCLVLLNCSNLIGQLQTLPLSIDSISYFNSSPEIKASLFKESEVAEIVIPIEMIDGNKKTHSFYISDAEIQELRIGDKTYYAGKYQDVSKLTNRWDSRHFTIPNDVLITSDLEFTAHNLTKKSYEVSPVMIASEKVEQGLIKIIQGAKTGIIFTIFFLGAITIFLVYIIGLYLQTRNPDFEFYAYYLGAILLHNVIQADAFLKIYLLFPHNPIWYHHVNEFFQMFIYVFFMLFIKVFLDLKTQKPKLIPFANANIIAWIVFAIVFLGTATFTRDFVFLQNYLSVLWIVVAMMGAIIIIGITRKSNNPVRYFILLGSVFLLIGSFLELYSSLSLVGAYNWNLYATPPYQWFPFNYTQLAILLEIICFALGIGFKISKQEKRFLQLQQKEIEDLKVREEKVELENLLLEKELTALRSQMNPHFLFNSLNSVNNYIMKEQPKEASMYLTRFSQLMRTILNNSKQKFVSLSQELEAISLYVELENLRFENKFEFRTATYGKLQTSMIFVPAMIIQPYIENAIKHGLNPKSSGGTLRLITTQTADQLEIVIEDDGIGREASLSAKSEDELSRKSHGMGITANRIDLLNKIYDLDASIFIKDKEEGTQVTITLKLITNETEPFGNYS